MFAMIRHTVDLAVSRFDDLKKSSWSPKPWTEKDLTQYAESEQDGIDNNLVVHMLEDKTEGAPLTNEDLEYAKELISNKFVVGLLDKFEESVHRFNLIIGVNEKDEHNQECVADFVEKNDTTRLAVRGENSVSVERGSETYELLAKIHSYDMELYAHIYTAFAEQRTLYGL